VSAVTTNTDPDGVAGPRLQALRTSVDHLRSLVKGLGPDQLTAPSYCSEWTIADVLSHVGSGAVIMRRQLEDTLAGVESPGDFAPSVWDTWNAKAPEAQAADVLVTDQALVDAAGAVSPEDRAGFSFAMGPMQFDFAGVLGLRLNEHVLHTWDVEVAGDPTAVLPPEGAALLLGNLDLVVRFSAKPTGPPSTVRVHTLGVERDLLLTLGPDAVSVAPGDGAPADLELPAEAFVRLVYGRLDPLHTPTVVGDPALLDTLRGVFPGF
jgi:uncharacterized protein (TIGR03083 family)